jgi:GntR family transcriptional regulator
VIADEATVALLGVATGGPLLSVERVAFTYGDKPVELRRAIYVTENYHYHNELS